MSSVLRINNYIENTLVFDKDAIYNIKQLLDYEVTIEIFKIVVDEYDEFDNKDLLEFLTEKDKLIKHYITYYIKDRPKLFEKLLFP
jgi:hypothetical protein